MARHLAIADVGVTLVELLDQYVTNLSEGEIALVSPAEDEAKDGTVRLGLYLYRVAEDSELRNRPPRATETGAVEPAPYALTLYYLLTAYPPPVETNDSPTIRAISQHELLGRAMQVFHEHAVLRGPDLKDSNEDVPPSLSEDSELRLSVEPDTTEQIANIWNTFPDVAYQPSVPYLVGPIRIDASDVVADPRVREKTDAYYLTSGDGTDE